MSTQAVTSGSARNNGGTIKKAGNITSSSPISVSRTLMDDAKQLAYGSRMVLNSATHNAFTNFAYPMVAGRYIMKKNTQYVNGVANDFLTSCAADVLRKAIPKLETTRRYDEQSWDYVTGEVTKGGNAGDSVNFGTDDAASPTDAVPGELQYKTGAKLPVQDEYKPRTG